MFIKHAQIVSEMNLSVPESVMTAQMKITNSRDESQDLPIDPHARIQVLKDCVKNMNVDTLDAKIRWTRFAMALIKDRVEYEELFMDPHKRKYQIILTQCIIEPHMKIFKEQTDNAAMQIALAGGFMTAHSIPALSPANAFKPISMAEILISETGTINEAKVCGKEFMKMQDGRTVRFTVTGLSWSPETGRNFIVQMDESTSTESKTEIEMQAFLQGCSEVPRRVPRM